MFWGLVSYIYLQHLFQSTGLQHLLQDSFQVFYISAIFFPNLVLQAKHLLSTHQKILQRMFWLQGPYFFRIFGLFGVSLKTRRSSGLRSVWSRRLGVPQARSDGFCWGESPTKMNPQQKWMITRGTPMNTRHPPCE